MVRIALLSDIHGNLPALEAVLADSEAVGGVDQYWVLGDLAAIGPQPVAVLERLQALPGCQATRGNTERYTVTGERPPPALQAAVQDPSLLPLLLQVERSFSWTQGAVASQGWLPYLAALPLELRMVLPDGSRLLGVHAAPGLDEGSGIHPLLDEEALRTLLAGCAAELVCVGHTHWPVDFQVGEVRVVNLGSVGNPRIPSLGASYALLEAGRTGYRIRHRQVAYDHKLVLEALSYLRHPAADYIGSFLAGDHVPPWGTPPSTSWRTDAAARSCAL